MTNELLPCPFCGSTTQVYVGGIPNDSTWIQCQCGATNRLSAWNTRADRYEALQEYEKVKGE